jgi:hypothetical protein
MFKLCEYFALLKYIFFIFDTFVQKIISQSQFHLDLNFSDYLKSCFIGKEPHNFMVLPILCVAS